MTTNVGLIIPNQGDLVDSWGSGAVNPDFSSLDGYLGGVQTISVSNTPVTLTAPAAFTPTPSGGPVQAANSVLSFTGTMTSNVQVTFPLPGTYIVENLTTGNYVLTFAAANSGQVVAVDQGEYVRLYNNGTNVRFVGYGRVGHIEIWAGLTTMPAWVGACTVPPYLLCDGTIYNFSTYPYLGKRLGGAFGGNGITTFAVPDLSGRYPLIYDKTGTRITTAGCGINGQTIGAVGGSQNETLITANLPPYTPSGTVSTTTTNHTGDTSTGLGINPGNNDIVPLNAVIPTITSTFTGTPQGGTSTPVTTVPPAQVTGIAVIRAA